jgi:ABC-type transport system substrate-binding protein
MNRSTPSTPTSTPSRCWRRHAEGQRNNGKLYEIEIRKGVKLHSGRDLDIEDVIASLKRWFEMTPRGKSIAANVDKMEAKGSHGLHVTLKAPVPALLTHMALPSGYAAIMAKEAIANPLTAFVGTGPYKFQERKPDQFVILTKFDGYARAARRRAAMPASVRRRSPSCASFPCRTPIRASRASSPASITLPTSCRSRATSASPRRPRSSRCW